MDTRETASSAEQEGLGASIRKRRLQLGMTLQDLAEAASLTKSFVSQVERGRNSPSISTLRNISVALEVPLLYFFQSETAPPVVKLNERRIVTFNKTGVTYEFLTPDLQRKIEMIELRLEPGQGTGQIFSHEGEECAVVIQGTIDIEVSEKAYRLEQGDSIYIGARQPHHSRNPGKKTAVLISAITPPSF